MPNTPYTTGEIAALVAPMLEVDAGQLTDVLIIGRTRNNEIATYGTMRYGPDVNINRWHAMTLASHGVIAMAATAIGEDNVTE